MRWRGGGLGRVAECASMNKTAVEDFHRAYQLNPKDPRILAAWIPRLHGQERMDALNRYAAFMRAAGANGAGDPKQQLDELRQREDLAKALNGHEAMALASPYQSAEVPLRAFVSGATHLRTFGLEVMVNGKPVRLVLDTGAAGIVLSHPAADRVGLARVADATVRGIGDNPKLTGGYGAIAERFQIGDVAYRDAVISVADQSFIGIEDGLIGANVLGEFLITLDFAAGKLRLDPLPGYHPGEEFGDRAVSLQMESWTRVFRFGHLLLLPARVGNASNRLFVLDTGAANTLISYELASEVSKVSRDDKLALRGVERARGRCVSDRQSGAGVRRVRAEEYGDDSLRYLAIEPSARDRDFGIPGTAGAGPVQADDRLSRWIDKVRTKAVGCLLGNSRKTERGAEAVPGPFCGARRTLCAFKELAQNRARRGSCSWPVLWCAPHSLRF